jgi:hypothetical protein
VAVVLCVLSGGVATLAWTLLPAAGVPPAVALGTAVTVTAGAGWALGEAQHRHDRHRTKRKHNPNTTPEERP